MIFLWRNPVNYQMLKVALFFTFNAISSRELQPIETKSFKYSYRQIEQTEI